MAKREVRTLYGIQAKDKDGSTVHPADGKKFTLEELQGYVGGYIELVRLPRGNGRATMYANEEGLLFGLAVNTEASAVAGQTLVGPVIVVRKEDK